jgi:hypothetical protein
LQVEFDARVQVTARDIPLGRLARQLGATCVAERLVPATRIDEKVSLPAHWLTMGELVETLGTSRAHSARSTGSCAVRTAADRDATRAGRFRYTGGPRG